MDGNATGKRQPGASVLRLSSNSLIVTHLVLPFAVEFDDCVLDGELEVFDGWEGAVGEEVALEITPGPAACVTASRS